MGGFLTEGNTVVAAVVLPLASVSGDMRPLSGRPESAVMGRQAGRPMLLLTDAAAAAADRASGGGCGCP